MTCREETPLARDKKEKKGGRVRKKYQGMVDRADLHPWAAFMQCLRSLGCCAKKLQILPPIKRSPNLGEQDLIQS